MPNSRGGWRLVAFFFLFGCKLTLLQPQLPGEPRFSHWEMNGDWLPGFSFGVPRDGSAGRNVWNTAFLPVWRGIL